MREFEETGGPPSPLSGAYLLIVMSEPQSQTHKDAVLDKLTKGILTWDSLRTHVDIDRELSDIANQAPLGEDSKNGERIIQLASDALVIEILIQPTVSTFRQCLRNLLSSFTRHRQVIHAGYSLAGTGSWLLQDGTFDFAEFVECLKDADVQRLHRVYDKDISLHVCCNPEGPWTTESLTKDPSIAAMTVAVNPLELSSIPSPGTTRFVRHISDILPVIRIEKLLQPSDVVGNIRFSKPTLYVFPGGQGDSALFGINGFNILIDGGFARKPCFWDFTRHMDRLDAVLSTRFNTSSLLGLASAVSRKSGYPVYPQIGHFFSNFPGRVETNGPTDPLVLNVIDLSQQMANQMETLQLKTQPAYRGDSKEPINLYHKVGHGTLDMFILSPSRDSKEVREFLRLWRTGNPGSLGCAQGSVKLGGKEFQIPLLDMVSICALIVWQPADPTKPVTRLLFSGSAPQSRIFEGMDKWRHLDFLKSPACMSLQSSESELDSSPSKPILNKKKSRNSEERAKSTTPPRLVNGKIEIKLLKTVSAAPRPKEHQNSPTKVAEKVATVQTVKKTELKPTLQEKPKTQKTKYEVKSKINSNWNQPVKSSTTESPKTVEILGEILPKSVKKDRTSIGETLVKSSKPNPVNVQVSKAKMDLKGVEAKVGSFKNSASPLPKRVPEKKTPEKLTIKAPVKPEKKKTEAEKPAKVKDDVKATKIKAGSADLAAKVKPTPVKTNDLPKSPKKKQQLKNDSKLKEPEKKAAGSLQAKAVKRPIKAVAPVPIPVVPVVPQPVPEPKTELNFTEATAPQAASSPILNKTFDFDEEDRLQDPFLDYRIVAESQVDSNGALDTSAEELKELASSEEDPMEENSRNALLMGHQSNLEDEEEIVIKSDSFTLEDNHEKLREKLTLDYFGAISKSEMEGLNEARQSRDTAYEEADDGPMDSSGNQNSAGSYEEVHDLDERSSQTTEGSMRSRTLEPELELSASRLERLAKEAFNVEDAAEDLTKEEEQDLEIRLQKPLANEEHEVQTQLELEIPGAFQNSVGLEIRPVPRGAVDDIAQELGALEHGQIKERVEVAGTLSSDHIEKLRATEQKDLDIVLQQPADVDQISELHLGTKVSGIVNDLLHQSVVFQSNEDEVFLSQSGLDTTLQKGYQVELEVPASENNINTSSVLESFKEDASKVLVQACNLISERESEMKLEFQAPEILAAGGNLSIQEPLPTTLERASGLELELKVPGTFQNFSPNVYKVDKHLERGEIKSDIHMQELYTKEEDESEVNFEVTFPEATKKVIDVDIDEKHSNQVLEKSNLTSNVEVTLDKQDLIDQLEDTASTFKTSVNNIFQVERQVMTSEVSTEFKFQDVNEFLDNDVVTDKLQDALSNIRPAVDFQGYEFHAESDDVIEVVDNIYSVANIREICQVDAGEDDPNINLELKAESGFFTQLERVAEKVAQDIKASVTSAFAGEPSVDVTIPQLQATSKDSEQMHEDEDEAEKRVLELEFKPELNLDMQFGKLEIDERTDIEVLEHVEGNLQSDFDLEHDSTPKVLKLEEVIDKLEKVAEDVKDSFQNVFHTGTGETYEATYQTNAAMEFHDDTETTFTLEKVIEKLEKVTEDVKDSFRNVSRDDAGESWMLSQEGLGETMEIKIPKPTVRFEMDLKQSETFDLEHHIHTEEVASKNPFDEPNSKDQSLPDDDVDRSDIEEDHSLVPVEENFGQKNALPLCFTTPGDAAKQHAGNNSKLSESSVDDEDEFAVPVDERFEAKDANPLYFAPAEEAAEQIVQVYSERSESSMDDEDEFAVPVDERFEAKDANPLCFAYAKEAAEQVDQNYLKPLESSMDDDDVTVPVEEKFEAKNANPISFATAEEAAEQIVQDYSKPSESSTDDEDDFAVPVEEKFEAKNANPVSFAIAEEAAEQVDHDYSKPSESSTDDEDDFAAPVEEKFEAKNANPVSFATAEEAAEQVVQNYSKPSESSMDDDDFTVPVEENSEAEYAEDPAEETAEKIVQKFSRPSESFIEEVEEFQVPVSDIVKQNGVFAGEAVEQLVQNFSKTAGCLTYEEDEPLALQVEEKFEVKGVDQLCFASAGELGKQVVQDFSQTSESSTEDEYEHPVPVDEKFEIEDTDPLCLAIPGVEPTNPFAQNDEDDPFFRTTVVTSAIEKDPFSLEYHAQNAFPAAGESGLPNWATRKEQELFKNPDFDKHQNGIFSDKENEAEVDVFAATTVTVPSFEANVITTSQESVTIPITSVRSVHLSQEYIVYQQPENINGNDDEIREEMFVTSTNTVLESTKFNGKESDDEELPEVHENFTAEFIKRKPLFSDDEDESEEPQKEEVQPEKPVPSKPVRVIKPRPIVDSDSDLEEVQETFTAIRVTRQIQFSEPQNDGEVNMAVIKDLPGTEVDPDSETESPEEQDSQEEIHFSSKKAAEIHSQDIEGSWSLPGAGAGLLDEFNHQKFVKQTIEIESRILTNHIEAPSSPFSDWPGKNPFNGLGSTPVIEDNFHKHIIQSNSDTEDDEAKAEGQVTSLSSNFSSRTYDLNVQNRSSEDNTEFRDTNINEEGQRCESNGPCSFQSDVSVTSEVRERGVFNEHFTTSAFSSGPASWAGYEDTPDAETSRYQLQRQDQIDADDAASEHSFTSSVSDEEQHSDADPDENPTVEATQFTNRMVPEPSDLLLSWNSRSLTGIKEMDDERGEDSEPVRDREKTGAAAISFSTWAKLTQENDPYENMMDDVAGKPVKDPAVFGTHGETQHYFNPFTSDATATEFSRGPFEISENVTILDDDSSTNGSDQDLFDERRVFRVTTTTTHSSIDVPGAQGIDPVIVDPFSTYSPFTEDDILRSWGKPLGLPAPIAPQLSNGLDSKLNPSQTSPARKSPTGSNMKTNQKGNGHKDFVPFYVDLAFVPHHADAKYSDAEFFKKIRARHYVFSGLEPSTKVLDALIEAKEAWAGADKELYVTIIPTYDSESLGSWISTNEARLARNRIDLAPSASRCTINLQDHKTSCSAYRLEF